MSYLLPHISLNKPALPTWLLPALLWLGLILVIGTNLLAKSLYYQPDWQFRLNILTHPRQISAYEKLAKYYWQYGYKSLATRELSLAQSLTKPEKVLGVTSDTPLTILQAWTAETDHLNKQYEYWRQLVARKNDYRDGYLILGTLALRLGKTSEAATALETAQKLDPNWESPVELLQQIRNSH